MEFETEEAGSERKKLEHFPVRLDDYTSTI